jgi:hypothetical protein
VSSQVTSAIGEIQKDECGDANPESSERAQVTPEDVRELAFKTHF